MLTIIPEKEIIYDVFQYDIILIGTNCYNTLNNGFQHDIKINFPVVNEVNMGTKYGDPKKLGTIKVVEDSLIFCLCYISKGYNFQPHLYKDYLNYEALETCIYLINKNFKNKKVATTLIGGSRFDGNGDRDKILDILENNSTDIDLYVYDYEQIEYKIVNSRAWNAITEQIGKISVEEYYKIKKEHLWKVKHGIYNPQSV